jgi:hypothetical protein
MMASIKTNKLNVPTGWCIKTLGQVASIRAGIAAEALITISGQHKAALLQSLFAPDFSFRYITLSDVGHGDILMATVRPTLLGYDRIDAEIRRRQFLRGGTMRFGTATAERQAPGACVGAHLALK